MLKKKIAFIGPGVMAEAMIAGLLRKKLASPENIIASGPREERGEQGAPRPVPAGVLRELKGEASQVRVDAHVPPGREPP